MDPDWVTPDLGGTLGKHLSLLPHAFFTPGFLTTLPREVPLAPPGPLQASQGVPGDSSVAVHGPVLWPRVTRRRQPARGETWRSWGPWVRGPGRGARDGGRPQTHRCVVDVGVRPLGGGGQVLGVAQPLFGGHAATGSHSSEGGPQGRAALLRV